MNTENVTPEVVTEQEASTPELTEEISPVTVAAPETVVEKPAPTPEERTTTLEKEVVELKDKYLRALAETDNTNKRALKERQTAIRMTTDGILTDFLEVADNFDRAMNMSGNVTNMDNFVKGVKLIQQQLNDVLARRGIKEIEAKGQSFNPELHEAIMQVQSDQPENTVVDIVQKGYMIQDRILRPARVTVAKAA